MNAALNAPRERDDRALVRCAREAGVQAPPLSRHALTRGRCNGLLLGYSALPERRIASGVAALARAFHALPPQRIRRGS